MENPWNEKTITSLGKKYNEYYEKEKELEKKGELKDTDKIGEDEFSWVLEEDKGKIDDSKSNSIKWGIPNQVIGDYEKANLFLCLLNPRTRNLTDEGKNLKSYINKENNGNGNEYSDNPENYMSMIFPNENVLSSEIRDLKNSYICENLISKDEIDDVSKLIAVFVKNIWDDNNKLLSIEKDDKNLYKKVYADGLGISLSGELVNECHKVLEESVKIYHNSKNKNDLKQYFSSNSVAELRSIFKEEIPNLMDKNNELKATSNLIDRINKNAKSNSDKLKDTIKNPDKLKDDEWRTRLELSIDYRMGTEIYNKVKNSLSPLRNQYYLFSYYWFLLSKIILNKEIEDVSIFYDELVKKLNNESEYKDVINKIDHLNICDLELFPYRSDDKSTIAFLDKNSYKGLSSSSYVAKLIVDRINDKSKTNPYFVFRS